MIEFPDVKCMNILCFVNTFSQFRADIDSCHEDIFYFEFLSRLCSGPSIWPLRMWQLTSADLVMTECLSMCLNIVSGNCRLRAACALTRSTLTQASYKASSSQDQEGNPDQVISNQNTTQPFTSWMDLLGSLPFRSCYFYLRVTCLLLVKKKQWESLQIPKLCGRN